MMQQARWIDPRPLAHERTRQADSLEKPDHDWAIALVQATGLRRVCPLTEANDQCRGLAGGVLRFSLPYAVGAVGAPSSLGADSALVYVRYTPVSYGVEGEIEFFMVRSGGGWRIASRRSMPEIAAAVAPRREITDPREAVDSLLAADRAFSAAAKRQDLVTAISSMFVGNVVMQAPGAHARGRDAAVQALSANADNRGARVEWTPIRGGVSSDGEHGFTFGYVTVTHADGSAQAEKYVAYWVRFESGWRVVAHKRVPRRAGEISLALLPPSLPVRALPKGDSTAVQRYVDELSLAEHAFARDAGPLGLGPAFAKWGAPDAVHTGGAASAEFVQGPQAIATSVGASITPGTAITWAPERVIVSSTGDLGVSIGTIRITAPATAGRETSTREVPFFTIWKRAWPTDPWRYVAE